MGGRSKGDDGAAEQARKESEDLKAKYAQEKMDMERTAAEASAGRFRAGRGRSKGLLSNATLGASSESTLGAAKV